MPANGEISKKFGVYKNLCCGAEIVIAEGAAFPDCPNHPRLTTVWKTAPEEPIRHISDHFPKKNNDDAA